VEWKHLRFRNGNGHWEGRELKRCDESKKKKKEKEIKKRKIKESLQ